MTRPAPLNPIPAQAQGAVDAARRCGAEDLGTARILGFTLSEESLTMATETRRQMHIWNEEDVRRAYTDLFDSLGPAVTVVFQDERCLDCGIVGDRRLVPGICHLRRIEVLECLRSTFILCHFKKKYKENINVKTQKESDSYVDIRQFQYRSYYIYFSSINVFNHHSQIYDRSTVSPTRRTLTATTAGTTHRPQFSAILVT